MRVMTASVPPESVNTGMIISAKVLKPDGGSHSSLTEKSRMRSTPSQKFGMATPIRARTIVMESKKEYCRMAQMIPKGSPRATPRTTAQKASFSVMGNRAISSSLTGAFVT